MEEYPMLQFIIGAVAGSVAIWVWGDNLRRYANAGTRVVRMRTADTLRAVEEKAEGVLDTAKEQVHSTLEAGQAVVRPRAARPRRV
jgi:hypothetical protein